MGSWKAPTGLQAASWNLQGSRSDDANLHHCGHKKQALFPSSLYRHSHVPADARFLVLPSKSHASGPVSQKANGSWRRTCKGVSEIKPWVF